MICGDCAATHWHEVELCPLHREGLAMLDLLREYVKLAGGIADPTPSSLIARSRTVLSRIEAA